MEKPLLLLASLLLCVGSRYAQAATFESSSLEEAVTTKLRERAKLTAPANSLFLGLAVSFSGNRALVGAQQGTDGSTGSAFIFVNTGRNWTLEAELKSSDVTPFDSFGYAVSLSGDRALVGAQDNKGVGHSGAAYTFVFDGTAWTQEAKLTPTGGQNPQSFGKSVSLAGGRALIGAVADGVSTGSAYVFTFLNGNWRQTARLTAPGGIGGDLFGFSVSLSGQRALIGARGVANETGSAYVYVLNGRSWTLESTLTASDGLAHDDFGWSVSLSGDRAIIGAPFADNVYASDGSVYVFAFDGTSWTQEAKMTASDPELFANFGYSVSLSGLSALVGAPGFSAGAAYLFASDGTAWNQEQELTAKDGIYRDMFGYSVFLSGARAVVGAYEADLDGDPAGAAYIFSP